MKSQISQVLNLKAVGAKLLMALYFFVKTLTNNSCYKPGVYLRTHILKMAAMIADSGTLLELYKMYYSDRSVMQDKPQALIVLSRLKMMAEQGDTDAMT